MVKLVTIRCVISLALLLDWNLFQLDVNNIFLHGDLIEEMYISPPEMFGNKVHKLQNFLYGLK